MGTGCKRSISLMSFPNELYKMPVGPAFRHPSEIRSTCPVEMLPQQEHRWSPGQSTTKTGYEDSNMVEAQARTPYVSVAPDEMTADQFDEKDQQGVEVEEEIPLRDDNPVVGDNLRLPTVPSRPLPFWIRYPKALLWCFVPSFLHPTDPAKPPKQLHPTAWLGNDLIGLVSKSIANNIYRWPSRHSVLRGRLPPLVTRRLPHRTAQGVPVR